MRKHSLFLPILLFAAASRFFILFHSQTHVHLAAASYTVFGIGVVPLKACIVVLSLVCLSLFYWMACIAYGPRTAALAALLFALSPSLLKWHFQVRGYSWYLLSLPVLTGLFLSMESPPMPRPTTVFLFGLASGLSVWSLELGVTLNAALWLLLALRGKLSRGRGLAGLAGFLAGYAPVLLFNLTHHYANWRTVFARTNAGVLTSLFLRGGLAEVFFREMPKFFGPDTVLWYYPQTPAFGYVLYVIALLALAVALWPFLKSPAKILPALRGRAAHNAENTDFLMLALTAACFVPYLVAAIRVPSYFLGGCFFISILMARLVERCLVLPAVLPRFLGVALLFALLAAGASALLETGLHNQIETLALDRTGEHLRLTRIQGRDIEAVERHLRENQITSIWTTISLVYPLIFESDEKWAVSSSVFGLSYEAYPPTVPRRRPALNQTIVFVMESDSPLRRNVEAWCARADGAAPLVTDCGTLAVIERRLRPPSTSAFDR